MRLAFAIIVLTGALPLQALQAPQEGLPLTGPQAETFLREAKVRNREDIGIGVTKPQKLTLSDGTTTCPAAWKTVDIYRPGITRLAEGELEANFRDSYKFEIAAYELDKLLGLGLVPPTVERRVRGQVGSLQLWIHGTFSEWDRRQDNLKLSSPRAYVEGMLSVRLFHQRTHNIDYRNARNILIGRDHVWAIDHSRAFRNDEELIGEIELERFSRPALEALRALTMAAMREHVGKWLSKRQLEAILARRDLIVERADTLITERGEDVVLFE